MKNDDHLEDQDNTKFKNDPKHKEDLNTACKQDYASAGNRLTVYFMRFDQILFRDSQDIICFHEL